MAFPEIELTAQTSVWTGGVDQKSDRVHETGLIGSLRWWYEALVRGMGGYACDPTTDNRCPDNQGRRCNACELFGCTGWARKFRLQVLTTSTKQLLQEPINECKFTLRFLPLRKIHPEELSLLAIAVKIAACHGAIGGKTTLKPQNKPGGGDDYGIVRWKKNSHLPTSSRDSIETYLLGDDTRTLGMPAVPDMKFFFFGHGFYLDRLEMNSLLGLDAKGVAIAAPTPYQAFLQGQKGTADTPTVSKKLFSFRAGSGSVGLCRGCCHA